jgi:hypothetical protein
LALVGLFCAVLGPSLQDAASLVAGEALDALRVMALGSRVSLVLSRAEQRDLTTAAHLASAPGEPFMLNDCDVDDDETSDMPLLIRRVHVLPPAAIDAGLNSSTHICLWPTHYLVRPQLLARL